MKSGFNRGLCLIGSLICIVSVQAMPQERLEPVTVYGEASFYATKINVQGKSIVGLKSWEQALSQLPGAYVYDDGGLRLSFSGGFSRHISVIVDGLLIEDSSSPDKTFDFKRLSLDNIKSLKVLSPGQSSFYSGNAFTIEIETLGKNELEVEVGSYGHGSLQISRSIKNSKFYIKGMRSDGISSASGHNLESDGEDRLYFSYDKNNTFGTRGSFSKEEIDRGPAKDDPNYTLKEYEQSFYFKKAIKKINLLSYAHYNYRTSKNKKDSLSTDFEDSLYKSFNIKQFVTGRFLGFDGKSSFVFEQADIKSNFNGTRSEINNKKNYSGRLALFRKFKRKQASLDISLWTEYDKNTDGSEGYSVFTHYDFKPLELFVGFTRSIKKPTLSQLFDPVYGFEDLSEETNESFDISLNLYLDILTTKFYFKNQNIDRLISFDSQTLRSKNIDKAKLESLGLEFKVDQGGLSAGLGGDYTLAAKDGEKKNLLRRPRWSVNGFLSAQLGKQLKLGLLYNNVGPRYDTSLNDFTKQVRLSHYKKMDMFVEKSWGLSKAHLRLQNIFNDKTESINGYSRPGFEVFVGYSREL